MYPETYAEEIQKAVFKKDWKKFIRIEKKYFSQLSETDKKTRLGFLKIFNKTLYKALTH